MVRGNGSQTPFQNEFWNNEKIGIYVDVITLEPLFASVDKFDGHIGLPTFTKPNSKDVLIEVPDNTNEMQRTQVRAKRSNARLGHVFADPQSPTGQRYVVYSAAFHFVPVEQLKDRGYQAYLPLFDKSRLSSYGAPRHASSKLSRVPRSATAKMPASRGEVATLNPSIRVHPSENIRLIFLATS